MFASLLGLALVIAQAPETDEQRHEVVQAYPSAEASADTLRYTVRAGETLIVSLPARVAGSEVQYEVVNAPALSWLVDRSFMWRTLERERGTLPVRLRRLIPGSASEPVVLLVEITP
ncbi:hypothetical protein [Rubrivirga sp.]|uniref:hypothetical protein n=1 Tax=Rubrivirga sp. TaxID=1885344 RepID=UPI003C7120FC